MADNVQNLFLGTVSVPSGGRTLSFTGEVNKDARGGMVIYDTTIPFQKIPIVYSDVSTNYEWRMVEDLDNPGQGNSKYYATKKYSNDEFAAIFDGSNPITKRADNERAAFINKNYTQEQINSLFSEVPKVNAQVQPAPGSTGTGGGTDPGGTGEPTESTSGEVDALSPAGEQVFGKDEFGYYIYPKEMNSGQDRIQFYQIKYVRDKVIQTETDIINKETKTKTKILGGVTLPMPNDISETNTVGWGEDGLSNAGAMFMQPLTKGAQIITSGEKMGQLQEQVGDPLAAAFKNGSLKNRVTQTLAVGAAAGVVGKFGININKEAYISRATGAAINPNLEFLFNGPKLRQFGFQFKLVARSKEEAKEIRKIIRFFKKGMSPRRTKSEDWDFFLGTPNVFRIKYMSGSQLTSIGQIKTCALVSFNANYTPDGFYAAYDDSAAGGSQPIAVTIQMAFTELTPVFSDEYDDSTEDTVGPNKFTEDYNILDTSGGDNK